MRGREGGFTLEGKLGRVCVVSVNGVLVTEASVIFVCQGSLSGARCQGVVFPAPSNCPWLCYCV